MKKIYKTPSTRLISIDNQYVLAVTSQPNVIRNGSYAVTNSDETSDALGKRFDVWEK